MNKTEAEGQKAQAGIGAKVRGLFNRQVAVFVAVALVALIAGFFMGRGVSHRHARFAEGFARGEGVMMHRGDAGRPGFDRRAGERRDGEEHKRPSAQERVDRMKQELGLNDQQVAKLKGLFDEQQTKMDSARKAHENNNDKPRQDWKAQREQIEAQIKSILTPDQQAKFQKLMDERKQHGHERRG